jgi:hypothetical protein
MPSVQYPPLSPHSIPPVQYLPFNTSRSIPPFNTLLNRRLPHIHRGPGVLTHSHIKGKKNDNIKNNDNEEKEEEEDNEIKYNNTKEEDRF